MTTEPVFVLDVNVLIALANEHHVHHAAAHAWFPSVGAWATTPMTEAAFVRLQSNPAVTGKDTSCTAAVAALEAMRRHPRHRFIHDDSSLAAATIDLANLLGHRQVTDFHLVNLCARRGAVLATFDARIGAALAPDDRRLVQLVPA